MRVVWTRYADSKSEIAQGKGGVWRSKRVLKLLHPRRVSLGDKGIIDLTISKVSDHMKGTHVELATSRICLLEVHGSETSLR
jgi:hypothetical protein